MIFVGGHFFYILMKPPHVFVVFGKDDRMTGWQDGRNSPEKRLADSYPRFSLAEVQLQA